MDNLVNPAFMKFIYDAADQTPQIWDQAYGDEEWDDEPTINYQMNHPRKDNIIYDGDDDEVGETKTEPSSNINSPTFKFPTSEGKCPHCGEKLVLKNGKFGDFYSCPNFPDCRYHCSTKQFEAALKYAKREEAFYGKPKEEPKKENPVIAEAKIELKTNSTTPGRCKTSTFNGQEYSNYLEMFCGECALYSHLNNKCIYREWDVGKERPACDMFVSNDKNERMETLEFLKAERARKKRK